jgi:hypothetical protein
MVAPLPVDGREGVLPSSVIGSSLGFPALIRLRLLYIGNPIVGKVH